MSFQRICTVRIGSVEIVHRSSEDLRIAFDISRDKSRDPNSGMVSIWGLAKTTSAELERNPRLFCELSCGYADEGESRIFTGVVLGAHTMREADGGWVTTAELGDDAEIKSSIAMIARTFPTGTPFATVITEIVKAAGLKTKGIASLNSYARLAGSATLPRPWPAFGQALGCLHSICRSLGFQYTIQDQEVIFFGLGKGIGNSAPVIRSENIHGSVSIDAEETISFSCGMIPDLVPGKALRMDARDISGDYVAISTKHTGDTHQGDWVVSVEADPFSKVKTKGLRVV